MLLAVVVARDDQPGPELRALQQDPLGRYVPPGGRVVRTSAAGESSGGILSKPTPATFRRLIAIPPAGADAALQEAIDAARAAGWSVDAPATGLGVTGAKRLPSGEATMAVVLVTDARLLPDDVPPPVLSIGLEHAR